MTPTKRTKIIATLGPATDEGNVLKGLLTAGVDLVRLNFSHGTPEDHIARAKKVRDIAKELGREIGILADLQGPKIRIAGFKDEKVVLCEGKTFTLDASLPADSGDETQVGLGYKDLPQDVKPKDKLLIDDGRIVLNVLKVSGDKIHCEVETGGVLSNNKGVNRLGGGISAKALTEKDKADIQHAVAIGADYIAISFPRDAKDIEEGRTLLRATGSKAGIIGKIERVEAVENLKEIINASDGVMVARGDLGVEIGDAELMAVQKDIIQCARSQNKAVITATQMMESMIVNKIPTRAEVSDVANAVLDGTDAVMLSAETATGAHPELVVSTMSRICIGAERHPTTLLSTHRLETVFNSVDEAIAMATMYTANHLNIKGIIALTESGSTPLWMSRIRSGIPIFGLSRHVETHRKMTLYRGVYPIYFDITKYTRENVNRSAVEVLEKKNLIDKGDLAILSKGDLVGIMGGTNAMKIVEVGNVQ